jgi:hypothetical protein
VYFYRPKVGSLDQLYDTVHGFEVVYLSNIDRILCSKQGEAFGILLPHFGQVL